MIYSDNFNRDWDWYSYNHKEFNFSGSQFDYPRKHKMVVYDKNGVDAKEAFYNWETYGEITPTKHPRILKAILKAKASINLNIKMWAEDRGNGLLPGIEFKQMAREIPLLDWMIEAVENQKLKYYKPSI